MTAKGAVSDLVSPHISTNGTYRHIWVVTGPAGCGKTTIATHLTKQLSLPYVEGDEVSRHYRPGSVYESDGTTQYHPQSNIDKMASGTPLTDADRWDWLIRLRQRGLAELEAGATGVVITCSALKRKYRDIIRIASYNDEFILVHFIYLHADKDLLLKRVKARTGHYMKDDMVQSQFSSLELPEVDEMDTLVVDVTGPIVEVQDTALKTVKAALEKVVKRTHAHADGMS